MERRVTSRSKWLPLLVIGLLAGASAPASAQLAELPDKACPKGNRCAELHLPALTDGATIRVIGTLSCADGQCDPDAVRLALLRTVDFNGTVEYFDVSIKSFDNTEAPSSITFGKDFVVNDVGANFGGLLGSGTLQLTSFEAGFITASALVSPPPAAAEGLTAFDGYFTKLADPRPSPIFIFQ